MFFDWQLKNYYALCFQLETDNTTAIGFTTSLLEQSYYEEVHCNAIYKTFKEQFELYGLISDVEGTGFLLAYLILDTTKSFKNEQQQGLRTEALTSFFQSLFKNYFNMHSKISVNINGQFLSSNEIRIKADKSKLQVPENIKVFRTHSQVNIFNQHDTNENYENIIEKHQILESKILALQCLVDHLNKKRIANNLQHVEAVVNNLNCAFTIFSNIEKAKNQRT
ncbi:19215_t:CDS:2 [Cetraspora pellucida]|uniref:19215_t:CDS:1 n=1 Tax=Cetraspora pellucida TaxID=1433469 RepID=A0A9N9HUG3_9GLOM|nr:19215_t:CDS:2 [Cetraspora pellucida]